MDKIQNNKFENINHCINKFIKNFLRTKENWEKFNAKLESKIKKNEVFFLIKDYNWRKINLGKKTYRKGKK